MIIILDIAGYSDTLSVQETIEDLLDDRFCRHIFPRGKNKYCYEHKYLHTKCNINNCFKHFKMKTKMEPLDEYIYNYRNYKDYI